jgi:putative flavoprotein involved in K+ transport
VNALVIGGGPAGLAAAATLKRAGIAGRVLERSARVGDSWRAHYDRLHLHTTRSWSALPGLPIPRRCGRWVSRDDFVAYQEEYAQKFELDIRHGVTVERIDRDDGGFAVATGGGVEHADLVVVATGYNRTPFVPDWARTGGFAGELTHTRSYKNPASFTGKRVLVVGSGNSGAEIAQDLAEHGIEVSIAIRTAPTLLPRAIAGLPAQAVGILVRHLPPGLVDRLVSATVRLVIGDLTRFGMPAPQPRPYSHFLASGVIPILDVGFLRQLRAERVRVVPAVRGLDAGGALLADGSRLDVDTVLLATGYRPSLEPLVGHLGVLGPDGKPLARGGCPDANLAGLSFVGYANAISGNFREIGIECRRLVTTVSSARHRSATPASLR